MRYFFDLVNGLGLTRDEDGAELPDPEAARRRAVREARSIMAEELLTGRLDLSGRIIARTETGPAFELGFDEAVEIMGSDDRA